MDTNDILLLVILTTGAVWMNWTTIKGDLFRTGDTPSRQSSDSRPPVIRPVSSRKKQKEVI